MNGHSGWTLPLLLVTVLLLAAAGGWALQQHRRARRLESALQAARGEATSLSGLLDVWCWRTDARHRLVRLTPPRGTLPDTEDTEGLGFFWEHFESLDDTPGLQSRIEAHGELSDIAVHQVRGGERLDSGMLRATPLKDAQGRFAGYIGTFEVQPETVALPAAPAGGSEDEQASFSYTVSHDLRAPIRVVEGFAKILKEDYGRVLDRIGNDHLERILSAAARMNRMIDSLLTLSQLSCAPLANEPVNLSQLAGFVIDDLRKQSPERQVEVHIEPGMVVQGDPTLLRVALENLLGNAWKYTGKTPNAGIWFNRQPERPDTFTIRDNGAGFDMRFADRLFSVFQRLHGANDFQGTGVGLASVRRIIRRHGGDIWAHSEVNQGAFFHFSLAHCEPGQAEPSHPR